MKVKEGEILEQVITGLLQTEVTQVHRSKDPEERINYNNNKKNTYSLNVVEELRPGGGRDLLLHSFMYSLVDSYMLPDLKLNPQPWFIGTIL